MKLGKLTSVEGKDTDSCSGRVLVSLCLAPSSVCFACVPSSHPAIPDFKVHDGALSKEGLIWNLKAKSSTCGYRWAAELGSWGCFYLPHWYSLLMLPSKLRGSFELCQLFWFGKTWSSNSIFKVHWSRQSEKYLPHSS